MPVEIREVVVRAVVTGAAQPANDRQNSAEEGKQAIVEACVREVMRILRKSKDR